MPYDLKGRNVLITGGSRGLGAVIAVKFAEQGCNVAVNCHTREDAAQEVMQKVLGYGVKSMVIKADAGNMSECARCVKETIDTFGGLDIIVGNAGWTKFAPFTELDALSEEDWDRCWAVQVKGNFALLRAALPTFQQNPEGGAFILTSSIGGITLGASSMAYAVTKAAQLHLAKCLAATQGPTVRINSVLPGLLLTDWGEKFGPEKIADVKSRAVLKKETDLEDCADAYIMLAKNTSITGQNIQVDSGLTIGRYP